MTLLTDNLLYDLVLMAATTSVIIAAYFYNSYKYWERRNFPYLPPKFPLGNSPYFLSKYADFTMDAVKYYNEMKKNGFKFAGIYKIATPALVLADPDYVRDILSQDSQYFINRGHYCNEKDDPLSAHLFALDGKNWKDMRTKLTPAFSSGKMKMMFDSILELSKYMTDAIEECAFAKKDIDILEFIACFTTDVIGSCAFGIDCNSFKHPDAEFRRIGKRILDVHGLRLLRLTFINRMPDLALKLRLKDTDEVVAEFFYRIVQNTVDYRQANDVTRPDFLQLCMDIKEKFKNTESPFTMDQMVAQAYIFFIGGFDTSATTMNFAIFELCRNQDVQDKAREEIFKVLEANGGQLTYESLTEMKYLRQVIDEALRLYPPVVTITRVCVKDYKLRDTDLIIEEGTKVVIPIFSIHRDPDNYLDPEKFDPERFNSENKTSRHPFVHLPFGGGPRNCLGLRFGLMQATIGLAMILCKFRLRLSPKTELPLRFEETMLLLKSVNTLYIIAEKL